MKNLSHLILRSLLSCILLGSLSTHAQNLLLGPGAGASLAGGKFNTLLGKEAGTNITGESQNTFVGYEAGRQNQANANTFLGFHAGRSNTTGTYNTYLGIYAGRNNTEGGSNTFIGRSAGIFNQTGSYNTFIGELAGADNGNGNENTLVGYKAGTKLAGGSENSFFGFSSGINNTFGSKNTFLGKEAGFANTRGSSNAFGGRRAGYRNTTGGANSMWGAYAGINNTSGSDNTFIGTGAGGVNTTGSYNSYLGTHASGSAANDYSMGLGAAARVRGSFSNAIGSFAYVHGSQRLVLGATSGYNGSSHQTLVGIGKVTPNYLLHLGKDDAAKPGSNVWTIASDRRLKKDIVPFTDGLSVITRIDPVRFRYNGQAEMPTEKEFVGIIAQDIQRIAPEMVGEFIHEDTLGNKETFLDYDGNAMIYMLLNSVKELNNSLEDLYIHHEELVTEMAELRAKYDSVAPIITSSVAARPRSSSRAFLSQAKLWQNSPNPSHGFTNIQFLIPSKIQNAYLRISSLQGQPITELQITERGQGMAKLNTAEFPSGTYIYQLILDGKLIDSKRMVLSR